MWQGGKRYDDTAKGDNEEEKYGDENGGQEFIRGEGGNSLTKADIENLEEHKHKPGVGVGELG